MTKSALYESVQMASLPQSDSKDESMLYACLCVCTHAMCSVNAARKQESEEDQCHEYEELPGNKTEPAEI